MTDAADPGYPWWAAKIGAAPAAEQSVGQVVDDAGHLLTDDDGNPIFDTSHNVLLAAIFALAKEMRAKMATFAEQIDAVTKDLTAHNAELSDRLKAIDARMQAMLPGSTVTQDQINALVDQVRQAQANADAAAALLAIRGGNSFATGLPISSAAVSVGIVEPSPAGG